MKVKFAIAAALLSIATLIPLTTTYAAELPSVTASEPLDIVPEWAPLQRQLFTVMEEASDEFLEKYVKEDGWFRYDTWGKYDDSMEPFHNWPTVYMMGGDERLLDNAQRQFEAITERFTQVERLKDEFPTQCDWFHIGEGYHLFYTLCLSDPSHEENIERAQRYAGWYLGQNYDPQTKIIRTPRNGSVVPTWNPDDAGNGVWTMEHYGLPFYDIEGIERFEDLKCPEAGHIWTGENAKKMAEAAHYRWSRGDIAGNLPATSLVLNTYLLTGEQNYSDWIVEYVDAWAQRIEDNDGILPDNVCSSGEIGGYMGGRWFGGLYGWNWPHGWGSLGQCIGMAAENAILLTGNLDYTNLPRSQIDLLLDLAIERNNTQYVPHKHGEPGRVNNEPFTWLPALRKDGSINRGDVLEVDGWYKFMPMDPIHTAHLWNLSKIEEDFERAVAIRNRDGQARWSRDWERIEDIRRFMSKDHGGHEAAWIAFMAGEYPNYPVEILKFSIAESTKRANDNRKHEPEEGARFGLLYRNPVLAEALVNLTLGGPLPFYNGGLLVARVRYFDLQRQRPGLPLDVAALVRKMTDDSTNVELVNLSEDSTRELIVQAGVYGEHTFGDAAYVAVANGEAAKKTLAVNGKHLRVVLPPQTQITLQLDTDRFVNQPSYDFPW